MLVLVCYSFQYTARDGRLVTIRPNESYTLVSRTNQHWWCVRSDQHARPFFVPAQYVTEVQTASCTEDTPTAGHPPRGPAVTPPIDHEDLEFPPPPPPHALDLELDPDPSRAVESELHEEMVHVLHPEPVSSHSVLSLCAASRRRCWAPL